MDPSSEAPQGKTRMHFDVPCPQGQPTDLDMFETKFRPVGTENTHNRQLELWGTVVNCGDFELESSARTGVYID